MKYIVSTLLVLLLSGCAGLPHLQPTPAARSELDVSSDQIIFLRKAMALKACQNSCWFGIEPGITNPAIVHDILVTQYSDNNVSVLSKENLSIGWQVIESTFPQHGNVIINDKGVVEISVFFETNSITLENFIAAIGPPEVVLLSGAKTEQGFRCDGVWGVLYPKVGLEVMVRLADDVGVLEKSQTIGYIGIIEPWTPNNNNWLVSEYLSKLIEWRGFGDYCLNAQ
jgi:hypothetical protein